MLLRFRKINSSLCSFCKMEDETSLYLFLACTKTKHLWKQLKEYMANETLALILLTPQSLFRF